MAVCEIRARGGRVGSTSHVVCIFCAGRGYLLGGEAASPFVTAHAVVRGILRVPLHESPALSVFGSKPHHVRRFGVVAEAFNDTPRHAMRGSVSGHGLVTFERRGTIWVTARVNADATAHLHDARVARYKQRHPARGRTRRARLHHYPYSAPRGHVCRDGERLTD